jgi:hypothetical protein
MEAQVPRAGASDEGFADAGRTRTPARVPPPIWIVVALLALEGIGNLFSIPDNLAAAYWLAAKCLFIVGLIRGWLVVYVLFLAVAILHVAYFLPLNFVASLLNLVMLCLAASARKFYIDSALR